MNIIEEIMSVAEVSGTGIDILTNLSAAPNLLKERPRLTWLVLHRTADISKLLFHLGYNHSGVGIPEHKANTDHIFWQLHSYV